MVRQRTLLNLGRHFNLPQSEWPVLQTDGYTAYAQYAKKMGLTHAQCRAHARRKVFEAQVIEPGPAGDKDQRLSAILLP